MSIKDRVLAPLSGRISQIQVMILVQLLERPKYGYEILRGLRDDFTGVWTPKTGTVYPALRSLKQRGLVKRTGSTERAYYDITRQGRALLDTVGGHVADDIVFNRCFVESTVKRLPPSFAMQVFERIHSSGMGEVMPEAAVVGAIERLPDNALSRMFLEGRLRVLQYKVNTVESSLARLKK